MSGVRLRRRAGRLRRALLTFARLPLAEQVSTLRLVGVISGIEVLLRTRPLPRVARLVGVAFVGARPPRADGVDGAPPTLSPGERRRARCARRVARHWPFCAGTCLRESLLVGHVLRRHRPRLVLGVERSAGTFAAHAWLDVGGAVIGSPGAFQRLG